MKSIPAHIRSSALISLVLVVTFIILELLNRRSFQKGFPIPLFGVLWLLPTMLVLAVMPTVRTLRAGYGVTTNHPILLLKVVFSVLVAWMWVSVLVDQMPCFLGVPNCD